MWMFGTGMPKSRRLAGGQDTALKPFYEPILLARRALLGNATDNIARHGTGALNIEACGVALPGRRRWPTNVVMSHSAGCRPGRCATSCPGAVIDGQHAGASRFLYCSKASRPEGDAGCEHLPERELDLFPNTLGARRPKRLRNAHPTVKPIDLMRWLVRLVTPAGGVVLDPFCGSGTSGIAAALEQRRFLGIERDAGHATVARSRIGYWADWADDDDGAGGGRPRPTRAEPKGSA
jgi:site-specific DNA-methyltransferase (adenine-specific)